MKNEEAHIEKCLQALINHGFGDNGANGEIILVDTGSTDNSLSIASKYLKNIYHFDWVNDFAKAKNYSISLANNEYIMIIDADEYMTSYDPSIVDSLKKSKTPIIGQIKRANFVFVDGIEATHFDLTERLFNKNQFNFKGCIHEQVVPINDSNFEYKELGITVDHDGYLLSQEELNKKADRNNELLFKQLEVNDKDPYIYFQLGQSYMLKRDEKTASEWLEKGLALDLDPTLEYVQIMVCDYGQCLLNLGEYEKASFLIDYYDAFSSCAEYVFMVGNIYLNTGRPIQAYKEYLNCLSMKNERTKGTTSFYPLHNIGLLNEMLGDTASAIPFYEKAAALGYKRSQDRLNELQ